MTFICAMGANGFFGAVADTLLTTDRKVPALHLPLHRAPQERSGRSGNIGSMAQKAVLIGTRTLVLWAGPLYHAKRALQRIEVVSDGGSTSVDVKQICADLEIDPQHQDFSLIHCFLDGDTILFNSANARGRSDPPFYYAGTGAKHLLDDLSPRVRRIDGGTQNEFLSVFIPKMLSAKINEAVSGDVFTHNYGGWFEIVEVVDNSFRKQNICLKIWEQNEENITQWGPLWFSLYNGHDLHIARVITHGRAESNVDLEIEVTVVPSVLHPPTPEPDLADLKCECAIELHVLVDRAKGSTRSVMLHGLDPSDRFRWERTKDGAQMALSPAVQTALRNCAELW